jgi:hypothetical protein
VPVRAQEVAYVALAVYRTRVMIAYVSPVLGTRDLNSVWFTYSEDGGKSWAPAILVSRSGTRAARDPRLAVTSTGALHLFWGQNYTGGLETHALRHVSSTDGGLTWAAPVDLSAPYAPDQLLGVASANDRIYVLFTQSGGDKLAAAMWCGGQWRGVATLPTTQYFVGKAVIVENTDGSPSVLWADAELTASNAAQLRWRLATLREQRQ